jgi:hypothetical protein
MLLMGKLTISMAIFNSKLLVYQRVYTSRTMAGYLRIPYFQRKPYDSGVR